MQTTITTISLDLDDTLWPVMPTIRAAEAAMRDFLRETYPQTAAWLTNEQLFGWRREVANDHPEARHDLTFMRQAVLRKLAQTAGYGEPLVAEAFDVFDHHRNQVALYPGVTEMLEALSARYRLVACSNGNASLEKTGLDRYFDAHVSARDAGAAKPDPRIFRHVVQLSDGDERKILHIGDDPECDVRGAREAGLNVLWVNRERRDWPDEHGPVPAEIQDIARLHEHLTGSR